MSMFPSIFPANSFLLQSEGDIIFQNLGSATIPAQFLFLVCSLPQWAYHSVLAGTKQPGSPLGGDKILFSQQCIVLVKLFVLWQ